MNADPYEPFKQIATSWRAEKKYREKLIEDASRSHDEDRRHQEILDAIRGDTYPSGGYVNTYYGSPEWRRETRNNLAKSLLTTMVIALGASLGAYLLGQNLNVQPFDNVDDGFMWRFPAAVALGIIAITAWISLVVILVKIARVR